MHKLDEMQHKYERFIKPFTMTGPGMNNYIQPSGPGSPNGEFTHGPDTLVVVGSDAGGGCFFRPPFESCDLPLTRMWSTCCFGPSLCFYNNILSVQGGEGDGGRTRRRKKGEKKSDAHD